MAAEPADPEFMLSLAKGLAVLRCFADQRRPLTIVAATELTRFSRASVRRCLHTLVQLGYLRQENASFSLTPGVLALGYAFLSSDALADVAQPLLDRLSASIGESCSLGVLEADEVCYVARSESTRIMSIALRVGSRLPLYCTSMGRVLLAHMAAPERLAYFDRTPLTALTAHTITERHALLDLLDAVKAQGFAIVDQELEIGLRSVAVPVFNRAGDVIGALNIGTQSVRVPIPELEDSHLPALRKAAEELRRYGV